MRLGKTRILFIFNNEIRTFEKRGRWHSLCFCPTIQPHHRLEESMEGLNSYGEEPRRSRFSAKLPLDYWETPDVIKGGLAVDISVAGLRIHSVHSLQTGTELKIRVYVSKEEYTFGSIDGRGKIIWRKLHREGDWKGYQHGLYLTEMTLDDRERLKQLLMHHREEQVDQLVNS